MTLTRDNSDFGEDSVSDWNRRRCQQVGAWRSALAGFLALACGGGSLIMAVQGIFLVPMVKDLGWTHAQYFAPFAIGGLVAAIAGPIVGSLADRFGVRRILLPGIALFVLNYAALGLIVGVISFTILLSALMVLNTVNGPILYAKAVVQWRPRNTGLILAVAVGGAGAGGIFFPPIAAALIEGIGWRMARILLVLPLALVAFPVAFRLVRPPKLADGDRLTDSPSPESLPLEGLTAREALRTSDFWKVFGALLLAGGAIYSLFVNSAPILMARGFDAAQAALGVSVFAFCQLIGRFVSGVMLDRIQTPRIAAVWMAIAATGVFCLIHAETTLLAFMSLGLVGLAMGAETEIGAYFTTRLWGNRAYGQIFGYFISIFTVGALAGPLILGVSFDLTGNYDVGLNVVLFMVIASGMILLTIPGYRYSVAR